MSVITIRNDDLGLHDDEFFWLHNLFVQEEIPVTYGVIPQKATNALASFLLQEQKEKTIEIVQHGFAHSNHSMAMDKYEFGASRTYEQQHADIAAGKARMQELFGSKYVRNVFVPPWHQFNADTLKALRALEFDTLTLSVLEKSLYAQQSLQFHTVWTHVMIGLNHHFFEPLLPQWLHAFEHALETEPAVGVLFHHSDLLGHQHDGGVAERARAKYVLAKLKEIAARHNASFVLQSEVLHALNPC